MTMAAPPTSILVFLLIAETLASTGLSAFIFPAFQPITKMIARRCSSSSKARQQRSAASTRNNEDQLLDDQEMSSFWAELLDGNDKERETDVKRVVGQRQRKPVIHFNNAGASPSPPSVLRVVAKHMANESVLGGYLAANRVQGKLDRVYSSVARLINAETYDENRPAKARKEIALVESATVAWTRVFYSVMDKLVRRAEHMARKRDEPLEQIILMSEAEYAANVVAAVKIARELYERMATTNVRWRVLSIPSTSITDAEGVAISNGVVDLVAFDDMLSGKGRLEGGGKDDSGDDDVILNSDSIAMVCITHIPTNSGIVNPVDEIGKIIERFNKGKRVEELFPSFPKCFYLVDACQSAGQLNLDVQTIRCHALTATGRKYLRGPRGTGFLYVQRDIADDLEPSHIDHAAAPVERLSNLPCSEASSAIDLTETLEFGYQPGACRFEFWESNVANKLGLGAAVDYALNTVGVDVIEEKCCRLGNELRLRLRDMEVVQVYHGNNEKQCGIVVFSVKGIASADVKQRMLEACVELSVVPSTSTPVDSVKTAATDLVRASLSYENTLKEIELFCALLREIVR